MFVAAYWSQRKESKESAADRIAAFLGALGSKEEGFATWYNQGRSREAALRSPLALDAASIATRLRANQRDVDRQPIPVLGFQFAAWNGSNASFMANVGSWSAHVMNSAVFDVGDDQRLGDDWYQAVLGDMVRVFDPDHAVVTSDRLLAERGASHPWEAGLFTFHRGGVIEAHNSQ